MLNLYEFKSKYITRIKLEEFQSTIAAELKNEALGSLREYYKMYHDTPQKVYEEIRRVCSLPPIVHAMNTEMPKNVRYPEFVEAMKKKDEKAVYTFLAAEMQQRKKSESLKRVIKKIIYKI